MGNGNRLNYKRTFFIGLAFLSICAFWQLYDNIVPLILKETFHMGETQTGFIMAADNVLALFLLPLFGALSDKTTTKVGKRTPFIVAGTIVSVIFMLFIPIADQQKNIVLFVLSLGAVLLAMGSYRSPAVALMPDLTPKPLRSQANAVINLMGAIGGILTLIFIKFLTPKNEHPNYFIIFSCVASIMVIAVIVLLVFIRENKLIQEMKNTSEEDEFLDTNIELNEVESPKALSKSVKHSLVLLLASIFLWFTAYNAVTTAFSRYAKEVWKMEAGGFANCLLVATGAAIISYIPIGFIATRFGRKKTIIGGILLITLSYLMGCFFFEYSNFINVVFALTGIGWAAINVNSYPMVVEMSKGSNVGKYTGLYYIISMTAQIITPILSGFLLEQISYRILFPYAVTFSIASLLTMIFVKHGDSKPIKKEKILDNFSDID
ncbi:MFS transporter [Clostridium sp. Marseille-P299]|uniref:MFS transporter n=1 Tax=Clostridium sp. Marseille-P299 TaxID=1805477 RepID=UPI00082C3604|nr:MFS transporter [Clostridium sp. Marseille-P299]